MSTSVKNTNQSNFDNDVVNASQPVLVDFYADWCGPCKAIAPVVEDLASAYDGRVEFKKVDVDDNPDLAKQLGIRSIPTLMLFKDGQPVNTVIGNVSRSNLSHAIDQHLTV